MTYKKLKLLTTMGLMTFFAISAHAGGIHCDDDPMCLPCTPGVACHNSATLNIQATSDSVSENLEESSKFDTYLAAIIFQAKNHGIDLNSVTVNVSIRLSNFVTNSYHRQLLGLVLGANRRVLFLSTTLEALTEIAKIPEVLKISAASKLEEN